MDETQNISPTLFPEIRPAPTEKGWCVFVIKGQVIFANFIKKMLLCNKKGEVFKASQARKSRQEKF